MYADIISLILIPLGIVCLFRPFLLLYLFTALTVLSLSPGPPELGDGPDPILRLGSINLFATDYLTLILLFLLIIFIAKNLMFKQYLLGKLVGSEITKIIIALFFWNIFIGIISYSKGFELQNVIRKIAVEALMFIAILMPTIPGADEKKEKFFKYTITLGLILVIFSLWKYFITHEIELTSSGTLRTLLGNSVVIFTLPICYMLFYSKYFRQHELISYSIIILFAIGIALTGHRSGFIALAFILLMNFFRNDFDYVKNLWIPTACATIIISIFFIASHSDITPGKTFVGDMVVRANDTFNLENKTTQERLSKWAYSIEIIKKYPLLGLGIFPVHTDSIDEDSNLKLKESFSDLNKATHNIFTEVLINTGLLGLSIIIGFFYVVFKQLKNISADDKHYANFLKTYVLSFLIFSQLNTSFSDPSVKIFFFIMLGFLNVQIMKKDGSLPVLLS